MPGAAFVADAHLSHLTWQDRPTIAGDSFFAFEQTINFCLQQAAALILGGDILDKVRPDPSAVAVLCRGMDRMQYARLPVYFIQGQHELDSITPWLNIHSWPQHVDRRVFEIDGQKYYGLDWRPARSIKQELAQIPAGVPNLVAHQVWGENMGSVTTPECTLMDVPDHVEVVYSGDYHSHFAKQIGYEGRTPKWFVSSGPTSARNISEQGQKGFWYIDANGARHSVPLISRRIIDMAVTTPQDLDNLAAEVMKARNEMQAYTQIAEPLVRFHFPMNTMPDAAKRLASIIGTEQNLFPDATIASEVVINADGTPQAVETVDELLQTTVEDPQVRSDLQFLFDPTRTPDQAVQELINEIEKTTLAQLRDPQGSHV